VEVYIGTDKVLTGYVDASPISYNSQTSTMGVSGRSKTGDLVDCVATNSGGQWKNRKVEQIITDLARSCGISVKSMVDTGVRVPNFKVNEGESIFSCIDRLLETRSLLSTDDRGM